MNSGFTYKLYSDDDMEKFVKDYYPDLFGGYALLRPIQRSDFFRYLILYHEGGYYADCDVYCNLPITIWPRIFELQEPLGFICGLEMIVDVSKPDWKQWWAREYQITQWTFASAPGHGILRVSIDKILSYINKYGPKIVQTGPILRSTGPGIWSDAIREFVELNYDVKFGSGELTPEGFKHKGHQIGDIAILSTDAFGFHSARARQSRAELILVQHQFQGSWKYNGWDKNEKTPKTPTK